MNFFSNLYFFQDSEKTCFELSVFSISF
jgi:hypothetical protein